MKTKLIAPWNLKPGMRIVLETMPRDMSRGGNPRSFHVMHVAKTKGIFSGATVWQVRYKDEFSSLGYSTTLYHGQSKSYIPNIRGLKADKVMIEMQPDIKATVTPKGIKFKLAYA